MTGSDRLTSETYHETLGFWHLPVAEFADRDVEEIRVSNAEIVGAPENAEVELEFEVTFRD